MVHEANIKAVNDMGHLSFHPSVPVPFLYDYFYILLVKTDTYTIKNYIVRQTCFPNFKVNYNNVVYNIDTSDMSGDIVKCLDDPNVSVYYPNGEKVIKGIYRSINDTRKK